MERGEIIIHPTESVYGFGGFLDDVPLARLRRLKRRKSSGFVVLIPSARSAAALLSETGRALAEAFWPGPLTLIVDDPEDRFHPGAKAADGSVALRVPGHPVTLSLLRETGRAITSTSANQPGVPPALTAAAARNAGRALGMELFGLDAGSLQGGAPSTLVRLGKDRPIVIRQGPLTVLELEVVMRMPDPHESDG
ncbi:MAG: Sua5/YciO/YrdC/YwlC family protein [Gemmatimonadetes bacterium]|nr:Sua5/YciO/YrdC/YwlC family protein [Gemmatimonadota bacterium]